MDIQKEREAFNNEFGVDDADTFPAFTGGIESSAALKCNWLGWKKRAEYECRENPEKIEIEGLKTIHKLCRFGADHNMEGCSFTEIVERMFDELELAKAQAVPESNALLSAAMDAVQKLGSGDFVLVPKKPDVDKAWNIALKRIVPPPKINDVVQKELMCKKYVDDLCFEQDRILLNYEEMIEAQEQGHD